MQVAPHDGCVDWNSELVATCLNDGWSHPTMGAWIEIPSFGLGSVPLGSHPTMGAWIEITKADRRKATYQVAPHDGCVDWNLTAYLTPLDNCFVAPHDGCVDWN